MTGFSVPMPPRSSIRRKVRLKRRRGQPTKKEKALLRQAVFIRAGGKCELKLSKKCIAGVLNYYGDVFERGHLVHLKSKGAGGSWELANLRWGCFECHLGEMHQKGTRAT
jgi:5-methylcytosine-specific restriction endonuclease McrA